MTAKIALFAAILLLGASLAMSATPEELAAQRELLAGMEIKPEALRPLATDTVLVADGQPQAVICHADDPAWLKAAQTIQQAIAGRTGVTLPLRTDGEIAPEAFLGQDTILLGHLDNNRHVARLYHNFYVCLDQGFTGHTGYVLRSVHNPFGTGHNALLVGGSFPEGTQRAADAFAEVVRAKGQPGALTVGRLLDLNFDDQDRVGGTVPKMSPEEAQKAIADGREMMSRPGEAQSGIGRMLDYGLRYHRGGDPDFATAYHDLMAALLEYYRTDKMINEDGMARYDNDFRDAWTFRVAILWDLMEETGLFTDQERLDYTNLLIRLGLECVLYQSYNRPATREQWLSNTDIVHNHNTFPALGLLFVGEYIKRHYGSAWTEDWLAVAKGIFNGLKHTSKPLEDAAAYQWLPIIHCAIYSLARDDLVFFTEGHMRQAANDALQVMDNAGYQVAFGDHSNELGSSGVGDVLQLAAWFYQDPEFLWGVERAVAGANHPLEQTYFAAVTPAPPADQVGVVTGTLPRRNYDHCERGPQYPAKPNLPFDLIFNKLSLRAGWKRLDDYLLLDGFGRGTHMHFDANAIVRYASQGRPLLVDGEYIKNSPKYHSSLVIIRDGQAELTPAVTRLDRAEMLLTAGCTQTSLVEYNGTDWTRTLVWRPNDYLLVADRVTAREPGDYTLRCCWRPWGEAQVRDGSLRVDFPPARLAVLNVTGEPARLEMLKPSGNTSVSRFSEQVGLRLEPGASHQFINVVTAGEAASWRGLQAREVRPGVTVVDRPEGAEVVSVNAAPDALPELSVTAAAVILTSDGFAAYGATRVADQAELLTAAEPVSLELSPTTGAGCLLAARSTEVRLRLSPACQLTVAGETLTAGADGVVSLRLPAGRHSLHFTPFPAYAALRATYDQAVALPALTAPTAASGGATRSDAIQWEAAGFAARPLPLTVAAAQSTPEPLEKYSPLGRLHDGEYNHSGNSVMWPAGETVEVTMELPRETEVRSVVLREWHMFPSWDLADRKLELSSDGFQQDIRPAPGAFREAGTESWGGSNVNTLMELPLGQTCRQLRLTLTPARPECTVYLAECQIMGVREGQFPEITALASGDLNGDGRPEIVAAGDGGEIRASDRDGQPLWDFQVAKRARINSLACADVNGDGRDEVIFGTSAVTLGLLSGDGTLLWTASPPRFRYVDSDVMTVFPGDVDGDGQPEIICGCASWQYFAYDATGEMIWRNVIYAHAATVGCAADLDGDGKDEVVAGNVYYTLNVIDHDGEGMWHSGNIGPEITAVAAGDVDGDGAPEVFAGVDGGVLHAYTAVGNVLWELNLGDEVTRIILVDLTGDGQAELVCAAESAHVFAISGAGKIIWRAALPDGCADLALLPGDGPPRFVAAAGRAGLAVLERDGRVTALHNLGDRAEKLVLAGERCIAAKSDGTLVGLDPSPATGNE